MNLLFWAKEHCFLANVCGGLVLGGWMGVMFFLAQVIGSKDKEHKKNRVKKCLGFWDSTLGMIILSWSMYVILAACPGESWKDLLVWFFSFSIASYLGWLNMRIISHLFEMKRRHPLSWGAILFALTASSCYAHSWGWMALSIVGPFIIYIVALIIELWKMEKPIFQSHPD